MCEGERWTKVSENLNVDFSITYLKLTALLESSLLQTRKKVPKGICIQSLSEILFSRCGKKKHPKNMIYE